MVDIKWVVVKTSEVTKGAELKFAEAELARQLPADVEWHHATDEKDVVTNGSPTNLVLVIAHPWISLDRRCLTNLINALSSGYDVVEACDSNNFSPMQAPDYATLRGLERYVDAYGQPTIFRLDSGSKSSALLQLMTVAAWKQTKQGRGDFVAGRVAGAYLHDVSGYFSGERSDVIDLIPDVTRVCLDVGGGLGNFLKLAKSQLGIETHLIELDPEIAERARINECADFVTSGDFLQYSADPIFDCITFLDMLEHVEHPQQYLLHSRKLLSDRGVVIVSIPNVGHWSVVADLLEGRWDYAPTGIQCITHLRFFTLKSITELFERSGFTIEKIEQTVVPFPANWNANLIGFNSLSLNLNSLNAYAYLVVGRPLTK